MLWRQNTSQSKYLQNEGFTIWGISIPGRTWYSGSSENGGCYDFFLISTLHIRPQSVCTLTLERDGEWLKNWNSFNELRRLGRRKKYLIVTHGIIYYDYIIHESFPIYNNKKKLSRQQTARGYVYSVNSPGPLTTSCGLETELPWNTWLSLLPWFTIY